ncbi:peptidase s8 and s53 subtilisin kexin sedolisin [Paramyrothecium foliicola]|nr:peptidase s8 and s53 subtilisin kexin sedolisin [Paramyrothecium foliicola]
MKWTFSLALLLAGAGHSSAHHYAQNLDELHGSMCVTYLSTFLVPVHGSKTGHHTHSAAQNTHSGTHHTFSHTTTRSVATSSSSAAGPTQSVEPVQKVILTIVPVRLLQGGSKRGVSKRALGGFVGGGIVPNPIGCDEAAVFVLISGQLSLDQVPIFYERGESFKAFPGSRTNTPTSEAVTTSFTITDGQVHFRNSALPGGEAGFCQVPESGQVYLKFTEGPPDCEEVLIFANPAELCDSSTGPTQAPSQTLPAEPTASTTSRTIIPTPKACTQYATLSNPMKLLESGDDDSAQAVLPFPVGVFGASHTTVYININGRLSLFDDSDKWTNGILPDSRIPPVSVLPYFDDLVLNPGSGQYVGFEVQGTEVGSRTVTFEWVAQRIGPDYLPYRFTATFFEDRPFIVTFLYSTVGDSSAKLAADTSDDTVPDIGSGATVGAQSYLGGSRFVKFSVNEPGAIQEGLAVQLDTTGGGSFKTGTFDSILC